METKLGVYSVITLANILYDYVSYALRIFMA